MGQGCSSACGNVEPDVLELSRTDSPDPVMYDLMRKSIQATTPSPADGNQAQHYKAAKRKPPGQNHLLYRNSKIETIPVPVPTGAANASDATSSSTGQTATTPTVDSGLWLPQDTPVFYPTRLLIRRRSLRVVEEGGGTHIYAIRYPEDTPDKIISEQAAPRPESARQEQCPPKKTPVAQTAGSASTSNTKSTTNAAGTSVTADAASKPKTTSSQPLAEGTDIFSAAAMASKPRQEGTSIISGKMRKFNATMCCCSSRHIPFLLKCPFLPH